MPTSQIPTHFARWLTAGLAILAASCATIPEEPPPPPPPPPDFSYWTGDGVPGKPSITIDLSEQAAYFYKDGNLVGRSRVATGRPGYSTPTGQYTLLEKSAQKRSNLYGTIYDASGNVVNSDADARKHSPPSGGRFEGASMPYWMRLTNRGVGMHAGPIPNPGSPASHGCIRLPSHMAIKFYDNLQLGAPIKIVR
ncbi:hypothetical protein BH23VER1_BH23VER1_23770 [soil metagenome]